MVDNIITKISNTDGPSNFLLKNAARVKVDLPTYLATEGN